LEDELFTDKKTNFTRIVNCSDDKTLINGFGKQIKKAKLEYTVVARKENQTLFDIKLYTGRQHQIRVQMAHIGCPLLGDAKYGNQQENGLALCSYRLCFLHPITKQKMDFKITPMNEKFHIFF